jgi:hypothetical protein
MIIPAVMELPEHSSFVGFDKKMDLIPRGQVHFFHQKRPLPAKAGKGLATTRVVDIAGDDESRTDDYIVKLLPFGGIQLVNLIIMAVKKSCQS